MNQDLCTRMRNFAIRTGMLRTSVVLALAILPLFAGLFTLLVIAILGGNDSWKKAAWLWSFPANNAWIFLVLLMLALGFGSLPWENSMRRPLDGGASAFLAVMMADSIVHFHRFCESQAGISATQTSVTDVVFLTGAAVGAYAAGMLLRLVDSWSVKAASILDHAIRKGL